MLGERGIDLTDHRSRTVTREILLGADLVVAMAREHVREAVVAAPEAWSKIFTLKELVRRGEQVGARSPDQPLEAWLAQLGRGRTTADLMGTSTEDDVADPLGMPRSAYERMAAELDHLLDRVVVLAWSQGPAAAAPVPPRPVPSRPVPPRPVPPAAALGGSITVPAAVAPAPVAPPPVAPPPPRPDPPLTEPVVEDPPEPSAEPTPVAVSAAVEPAPPTLPEPAPEPAIEPAASVDLQPVPGPSAEVEVTVLVEPLAVAPTRVVIGSDHAGLDLKAHLVDHLRDHGHAVDDVGTHTPDSVDYPDFGALVARTVAAGDADVGICVCGTGIGIGIAANKVPGVRAAIVHDVTSARMARQHNDANVLCVGARLLGPQVAADTVDAFLEADFEGGRHQHRIDRISELEDQAGGKASAAAGPGGPDDELFDIITREVERQNTTLQLIASENFTSPAVMAAQGSVLTNKYSEGYPGKRYYGGNYVVDEAEELARERVKALFGAEHANVQPHSGASANMAVYLGLLEPGDTVLGMRLDQGGHLTHGSPVNFSGRLYHFVSYGVTETDERIDYDQIRDLAHSERPKAIVAGATAYPRIIHPEILRSIADEVGALLIFDAAHIAGLIAGGAHPNPVPHADVVTFTTHKTLRGPRSGCILSTEAHAKAIDKAVFPGLQGGPLMHVVAAKAVAFREASQPEFREYATRIVSNAQALASALAAVGFRLVSGGTDNHLMLVDLRPFDAELTGKQAQETLDRAGITLNKNQIPGDPRSPFVTSGLRIGTAAVTTAGMGPDEMTEIASLIGRALRGDPVEEVREAVATLCAKFTPYPNL